MNCNELQKRCKASCYLIKCPKALQWFHDGHLCKHSEEERQAGRFELFLDLLYVAIVANFSDELTETPDGAHLAKYLLAFAPCWYIWSDLREIMNSYYTDDLIQRLVVLWVMALLILYANSAGEADVDLRAMRVAVGTYIVARFTTLSVFLITSFASFQHRIQARMMAGSMAIGLFMVTPLLSSALSIKAKAYLMIVAIIYQEAMLAAILGPFVKRILHLKYSTAVDIAHEVDRLAAFFIIILGEFVYSIIVGNPAGIGLTKGYLKAVCTLIIAFTLNWIYASGDGGGPCATHPIRRSSLTAFGFFLLHLPMAASFLIGGHVAAVSVSLEDFDDGHRWLLGGGLGVGMFCLWVYAMLYRTARSEHMMLSKNVRVGMRLVISIALILLPKFGSQLSAERMMLVVAGLFALLLVWETFGGLSMDVGWMEPWECHRFAPGEDEEEAFLARHNSHIEI